MPARFIELVSWLRGEEYDPSWDEKLETVFYSLPVIIAFILAFAAVYLWFFRRDAWPRMIFIISGAIISGIIFLKFFVFHFFKGYIPDRLVVYAIPSPKALGVAWLLAALAAFFVFLRFRERIENYSPAKFLSALYCIFVIFSIGVAGIREGIFSIYEPFSRTAWEYTGNLPLVDGVGDFLSRYSELQPQLAHHTNTHPPGYTIILYLFHAYLHADIFMLSVLVVMVAGLTFIPLYYFLKNFISEREVRRGLEIFVFIPSAVMMSATSMEAVFLFFVWSAVFAIYRGWSGSFLFSFAGGMLAGAALLMNFTFLLLAPFFGVLAAMLLCTMYSNSDSRIFRFLPRLTHKIQMKHFGTRVAVSVFGFVLFFILLYAWSGYSILENFAEARIVNQGVVRSNFESVSVYFTYIIMNMLAFSIYLGIPVVYMLGRNFQRLFAEKKESLLGFILLAFFLGIGVFQGEVGRLWLFWMPIFVLPLGFLAGRESPSRIHALVATLVFQIVSIQMLLYTYW